MKYEDIISMEYPPTGSVSRISPENRAAQFSSFAALTGYDGLVSETARLTGQKIILSEEGKELLDIKQRIIREFIHRLPEISVTYFVPDERKEGGKYVTHTGNVRAVDDSEGCFIFAEGERIYFHGITDIEGEIFRELV